MRVQGLCMVLQESSRVGSRWQHSSRHWRYSWQVRNTTPCCSNARCEICLILFSFEGNKHTDTKHDCRKIIYGPKATNSVDVNLRLYCHIRSHQMWPEVGKLLLWWHYRLANLKFSIGLHAALHSASKNNKKEHQSK